MPIACADSATFCVVAESSMPRPLFCTRIVSMRTKRPHIRQSLATPLIGFGVVLLSLLCFLLLLWALIIIVRVVLG